MIRMMSEKAIRALEVWISGKVMTRRKPMSESIWSKHLNKQVLLEDTLADWFDTAVKASDEIKRLERTIEVEALNWTRQHQEIERLKAALEFYAKRENYLVVAGPASHQIKDVAVMSDGGLMARKALANE